MGWGEEQPPSPTELHLKDAWNAQFSRTNQPHTAVDSRHLVLSKWITEIADGDWIRRKESQGGLMPRYRKDSCLP